MCGIAGAIWSEPRLAIEPEILERMTACLAHRGPDDSGRYRSDIVCRPPYEAVPGIALGHRRLSIIDLAGGHQPLANEQETVWIVFNGEIYNYRPLRQRLEAAGHRFRSDSDTEVIVHLYEDEGLDALHHLAGMFAFALWDSRLRRLVLARDRLGKKPLVYRQEPGRLLFASELKSLLAVPGVPREIDPAAIDEYLTYQYVPPPRTIFRGIRKLPPGHVAVWQNDQLSVTPYWQPELHVEKTMSEEEGIARTRKLLEEAVAARLVADVPLGAFLSGGVDSSLVVALMQRHMERPVQTFSIGFSEPEYDESRYAELVARHVGAEHHTFRVEPQAAELLPELVHHYDEPFGDSSAIPTYYLARETRRQVTVALTGDGGDELFAGYERYRAVAWGAWIDQLPWPLPQIAAADMWQWLPGSAQRSFFRRIKRFSAALALPPDRRYLEWIATFGEERRAGLYREEFLARLPETDPGEFLFAAWRRCGGRDSVTCASLADLVTYLPGDLLVKVDIASMAHGLECRAPFLDHRLVELAIGMPVEWKLRGGRSKSILRQAFGQLLPEEIWSRPKMGFGVPLEPWFRGPLAPLVAESLLAADARTAEFFSPVAVRALVEEHASGHFDHGYRLWSLLVLEQWMRTWIH